MKLQLAWCIININWYELEFGFLCLDALSFFACQNTFFVAESKLKGKSSLWQ